MDGTGVAPRRDVPPLAAAGVCLAAGTERC